MDALDSDPPPPYSAPIRTVYDQTHRGIWYASPCIASLGSIPNLLGHLEHHQPTTDGTFGICVAGGSGVFISNNLYQSIPEERRPTLDTSSADTKIKLTVLNSDLPVHGSTYFPFLLADDRDQKVRVVLLAYVVPDLLMGMFMGDAGFPLAVDFGSGEVTFHASFGEETFHFPGISR